MTQFNSFMEGLGKVADMASKGRGKLLMMPL